MNTHSYETCTSFEWFILNSLLYNFNLIVMTFRIVLLLMVGDWSVNVHEWHANKKLYIVHSYGTSWIQVLYKRC